MQLHLWHRHRGQYLQCAPRLLRKQLFRKCRIVVVSKQVKLSGNGCAEWPDCYWLRADLHFALDIVDFRLEIDYAIVRPLVDSYAPLIL